MSTTLISPAELVGLALRRQIPTNFERAWEKATGKNPVTIALRRREADLLFAKTYVMAMLFFIPIVGAIGGAVMMEGKAAERWGVVASTISAEFLPLFFAALLLFMLPTTFFGNDHVRVRPSQAEFDSLKEFCAGLSALCEWGKIDPKDLEAVGWEVLKQVAEKILVIEAELVLQHDKTNADISTKYDTFLGLGLVKAGGYTKYFNEAREKIANRNRNVTA